MQCSAMACTALHCTALQCTMGSSFTGGVRTPDSLYNGYLTVYNTIQITPLIPVPRPKNHVTKLFNGTYELPRWPRVFFLERLGHFQSEEAFGSSCGPLFSEIGIFKVLKNTKFSHILCTFGRARLRECLLAQWPSTLRGSSCNLNFTKAPVKD
jgi:hypothetical protein